MMKEGFKIYLHEFYRVQFTVESKFMAEFCEISFLFTKFCSHEFYGISKKIFEIKS